MNRIIIISSIEKIPPRFSVSSIDDTGVAGVVGDINDTGAAKLVIQEAARIVGDEAMESACRDYVKSRKEQWEPEL